MPNSNLDASRRQFLKNVGAGAALASAGLIPSIATAVEIAKAKPESLVETLFKSLDEKQRKGVCFDWDYTEKQRGLLRTRVANNWHITGHGVTEDFYTADQQEMIRAIFKGIIAPDWHKKYDQQIEDDCGGWGDQSIAIFGEPGEGKFELALTGRHLTLRCDGNSADHVAFGGPIFYGHAPEEDETKEHDGNVFWEQAVEANKVYEMLDGKQRKMAQVAKTPAEQKVDFRDKEKFTGIPITELSADQKEQVQKTLQSMFGMFRHSDQAEALECLKTQGGIDACNLAFYTDHDIGKDEVWDNWRIEGPSFVWHFRGSPHVHVWVNLADDSSVKLNA